MKYLTAQQYDSLKNLDARTIINIKWIAQDVVNHYKDQPLQALTFIHPVTGKIQLTVEGSRYFHGKRFVKIVNQLLGR